MGGFDDWRLPSRHELISILDTTAQAYCAALALAGKSGWRVPSLSELLTLIDQRASEPPLIDHAAFPDTPSDPFWTSSYFGGMPGRSWQVYFDRGNGLYGLPSATFRVRCVTAAQ